MKYQVWFEPTPLGIEAFSFKERMIDEFEDKEDAHLCAYLEDADEPAPDKRHYARYVVREVPS
jgi:hypothetical protein